MLLQASTWSGAECRNAAAGQHMERAGQAAAATDHVEKLMSGSCPREGGVVTPPPVVACFSPVWNGVFDLVRPGSGSWSGLSWIECLAAAAAAVAVCVAAVLQEGARASESLATAVGLHVSNLSGFEWI